MITSDPFAQVALWVLPGAAIEPALATGGWLFPAGPPAALADGDRVGSVRVPTSVTVHSGGTVHVPLVVTHPAGGAPWPTLDTFPSGQFAVRLSLQWESPDGSGTATGCPPIPGADPTALACQAADLPRVMLPDTSAGVDVVLLAESATGAPLPAGTYTVRIGLFQQLVGGFSDATSVSVHVVG